jgi:hypothetical protein
MEWARSAKFIHVCLLALAESFISWLIEFKRGEIATELREFWLWRGFIIYGVQLGIFSTDPCERAPSVMAEEMVHDCCSSSSKLGAIFCRQENVSLALVTSRKLHRFLDC